MEYEPSKFRRFAHQVLEGYAEERHENAKELIDRYFKGPHVRMPVEIDPFSGLAYEICQAIEYAWNDALTYEEAVLLVNSELEHCVRELSASLTNL